MEHNAIKGLTRVEIASTLLKGPEELFPPNETRRRERENEGTGEGVGKRPVAEANLLNGPQDSLPPSPLSWRRDLKRKVHAACTFHRRRRSPKSCSSLAPCRCCFSSVRFRTNLIHLAPWGLIMGKTECHLPQKEDGTFFLYFFFQGCGGREREHAKEQEMRCFSVAQRKRRVSF
ncbi:hypothetical protein CDAR_457361 [Caerostris darwini]|uniref:Uncharacterized protein n=1 Tax=Caerostris darwini TaxID=1538125 RepID=A0AAV4PCZ9_9ARAC|nr:hypothetical protein CDAR_457361 [Caerostris darwini]